MDQDIIKKAKSLKKTYVVIEGNTILGTDLYMQTLSRIYLEEPVEERYAGSMQLLEKGEENPDIAKLPDIVYNTITGLKYRADRIAFNNKQFIKNLPLNELDSFIESTKMKSADGAMLLNIPDRYLMSIYSSLHPLNKSDLISVDIFEYDKISFLAKFTITKKKYNIEEYIRYLYLT